jgi:peptidoglycan/LPS O-acetylase OafA/YrhL
MRTDARLPSLDGIRFLAMLMVFVDHVEQDKSWIALGNDFGYPLEVLGRQGVEIFFVLSGYLITYLLFVERRDHGSFSIGRFYLRRTLRIWPLYFLVVFNVFFVVPALVRFAPPMVHDAAQPYFDGMWAAGDYRIVYYLLFLPHIAWFKEGGMLAGTHLWSIGVEEQFYLAWPLLLRAFGRARPLRLFLVVLAVNFGLIELFTRGGWLVERAWPSVQMWLVTKFFEYSHFHAMTLGAIAAWLRFFHERRVRAIASHPVARFVVWLLPAIAIYAYYQLGPIGDGRSITDLPEAELLAPTLYAVFILGVSTMDRPPSLLENAFSRYMGKISYGFYMFHTFLLIVVLAAFERLGMLEGANFGTLYYLASFLVVTAAAGASFRWLETPFLRLKDRFHGARPPALAAAPTAIAE